MNNIHILWYTSKIYIVYVYLQLAHSGFERFKLNCYCWSRSSHCKAASWAGRMKLTCDSYWYLYLYICIYVYLSLYLYCIAMQAREWARAVGVKFSSDLVPSLFNVQPTRVLVFLIVRNLLGIPRLCPGSTWTRIDLLVMVSFGLSVLQSLL